MQRSSVFHNVAFCVAGLALAAILALAGCRASNAAAKPRAVATVFAYYDALRAIAGPDMPCAILLPPQKSPHDYEPTVHDRAVVAGADLVVKNGLGIDRWVDKLAEDNKSAVVIDASEVIREKGIHPLQTEEVSVTPASQSQPAEKEDVSAGNPHIWLDPAVQKMVALAIRDALVKIDPVHKSGYEARAKTYVADLVALDQDFARAAANFKQKEFIGFHSAYDYLARRYGLKQVAAVEELPDWGPSPQQVRNIIQLIRDKHIKVIFTETAFNEKVADGIIAETHVKTGVLQPLETYDNVDQTYVSLMRENLKALQNALN